MIRERRTFLKRAGITTLGVAALGTGVGLYAWHGEPGWLEVSSTTLHLSRLDPAFAGYRIVQLSDIHIDHTWMDKGRLEAIVALANEQKPDLLVITGDFVTYVLKSNKDVLSVLKNLHARDGVFCVLGNHDHWGDPALLRTYLTAFNIQELNDTMTTIRRGNASLHLLGIDDLWQSEDGIVASPWVHKPRLMALVEQLPKDGAAILLVHEPDFADVAASSARIDLQLSGHSHGGQVRIPFIGAPVVPPLGRKYVAGLYKVGSMQHYTSRGLGLLPPQVRLNCRPEIAVFICQPINM